MAYEKTHDLLDLAVWMQSSREGVSLNEIAQRFNVSRRTAERMRDMILAKFPQTEEIFGENNCKRWFIPQGTLKDFIQFSGEELAALETARKLLAKNNLTDKAQQLERIGEKIKAVMNKDVYRRIEPDAEALLEAEGFALRPGPKLQINETFLPKLREAILACKKVILTYRTPGGKLSPQTVSPYGFLYGNKHYLVAFSDYSKDYRYYPLHRLTEVTVSNDYFNRDEKFSLADFTADSFGVYREEPFETEWLFAPEAAEDAALYCFHPSQQNIINADGSLTVRFKAGGLLEMAWHLYTWGNKVKVIKPADFYQRLEQITNPERKN